MSEILNTCCTGQLWMQTHVNPVFRLLAFVSDCRMPRNSFRATFPTWLPSTWELQQVAKVNFSCLEKNFLGIKKMRTCMGKSKHMVALITVYDCKPLWCLLHGSHFHKSVCLCIAINSCTVHALNINNLHSCWSYFTC